MNIDKCDGVWRLSDNGDYFRIGNKCLVETGKIILWEHSVSLKDGKENIKFEGEEISPKKYKLFKENFQKTLENDTDRFFNDFLEKLPFHSGGPGRMFGERLAYPLTSDEADKGKIAGIMLCNKEEDPLFSVYNKKYERGYYLLEDFSKGASTVFLCNGIREGELVSGLTEAKVFVFSDREMMRKTALFFSHKNPERIYYALGKNPGEQDLQSGLAPAEFFKEQRASFSSALNVVVKFPPFTGFEDGCPKTFHDFFRIAPLRCEEALNVKTDDFPALRVLGHEGRAIWLWSRFLKNPLDFFANSKFPEFELVAPSSYWKEKFKTTKPDKILEQLYGLARGKVFQSHKVRMAGIYKEGKNLIINTGKEVIGNPSEKEGFLYLKGRSFPAPQESAEINMTAFNILYENIFKNMGFRDVNDGLSLFAWGILAIFAKVLPMRFSLASMGDSSAGKNFTKDYILMDLQEKFKDLVRECPPGCTYASFKQDLRDGATILYFEEEEGKTYDKEIIKVIRSSSYKETEIRQMRRTGGSLKTSVSFMRYTSFNYFPDIFTIADGNRTYEINYSLEKAGLQSDQESLLKGLMVVKMPELGYQCYNKLYIYWKDFLKYIDEAKNSPQYFGFMIKNHKRMIFSQLYAFYKVLGALPKENFDKYMSFLRVIGMEENTIRENDDIVSSIVSLYWLDSEGFKKKSIKGLLLEFCPPSDFFGEQKEWIQWKRWAYHLLSSYAFKIRNEELGLCLVFPSHSWDIIKGLTQQKGIPNNQAKSYSIVINSQYGTKKVSKIAGKPRQTVSIPLKDFLPGKIFEKFEKHHEEPGIKSIYQ